MRAAKRVGSQQAANANEPASILDIPRPPTARMALGHGGFIKIRRN